MKRWKYIPKAGLGLCAAAWLALGANYVWTNGGSGTSWATPANWNLNSGYPDGTNDTAEFPYNSGTPWTCTLIGEQIGAMTIKESTTFDAPPFNGPQPPIMSVSELTIDGSSGAVEVTVTGPYIQTY